MADKQQDQIQFDSNGTEIVHPDKKMTYHHYGKLAAKNTNCNSANIESSLDKIYERFLNEQQLNEDGIKQRISKLRAEVLQKKNLKISLQADITSQEQFKEDKEQQLRSWKLIR